MISNINQAIGTSFLLEIPLFSELNYFVQNVSLPGLSMGGVDSPYQNWAGAVPSNRIEYDQLSVTFLVDEDWQNWYSIALWMERCRQGKKGNPDKEDFQVTDLMCDLTLHLTNSNKNTDRLLKFIGAFPVQLAPVDLNSSTVDATPVVCSVVFRYQFYRMLPYEAK